MSVPYKRSRREFLQTAVAATSLAALAQPVWAKSASANEKLDVAVIGISGRGRANLNGVSSQNIVALCDIDKKNLANAAKRFPKAKLFSDFRKMLPEIEKQIDAVVVSTPDHTHAPAGVMAMRLKKHLYCEKPLAHEVYEVRTMIDLAAKNKLSTQMGTQIHAGDNYRRVVELVQSGAIGPVDEVHVWSAASYGGMKRPTETPPVPENIDWDLWLGPAPFRPYHPVYMPAKWRNWWDFGCGSLGDFGCHYMDLPFWALGLSNPTTIEAQGPPVDTESTPKKLSVQYTFPARGKQPAVKMTWYDGGNRPKLLKSENMPQWRSGVIFVGSKGLLLADYSKWKLFPEKKFADFVPPKPTIANSIGHHNEWIEACKTGSPTTCNFGYSGPLAETVLLGNVAYRVGQKLEWDAANLKATNCPEADEYIKRTYREGWTL